MARSTEREQTGRVVQIKQAVPRTGLGDAGVPRAPLPSNGLLWGVGAVSTRLDIARPTLRTWDRRYGLGPSLRTAGGHRRYTETDVARVQLMNKLLDSGVAAAQAAHIARTAGEGSLSDGTASARPNVISRRRASGSVSSLMRATMALQSDELSRAFSVLLQRRGAVEAWDQVFAPFLIEIGDLWASGELGVECEHLASSVLAAELRAFTVLHRNHRPAPARLLLACADDEEHALPIYALEAALAENKVPSIVLGQRLPAAALAWAMTTRKPAAVFLWASLPQSVHAQAPWRTRQRGDCLVVLGGPGWDGVPVEDAGGIAVERADDLADAAIRLVRTLSR